MKCQLEIFRLVLCAVNLFQIIFTKTDENKRFPVLDIASFCTNISIRQYNCSFWNLQLKRAQWSEIRANYDFIPGQI